MQLQAYLTLKGLSEKQFADQVGASESGVLKWVRRERIPRPEKIREISRITDGAVTAADMEAKRAELGVQGQSAKEMAATLRRQADDFEKRAAQMRAQRTFNQSAQPR